MPKMTQRPQMYVRPFSDPDDYTETSFSQAKPMEFSSPESWDRFALNPVVSGEQMRTLLDPVEHLERVTHSVDVSAWGGSMSRMWSSKTREGLEPKTSYNHGAGVYDWMSEGEKQRTPITIQVDPRSSEEGYGQEEGHHRAAIGAHISGEKGSPHLIKFEAQEASRWGMGSKGRTAQGYTPGGGTYDDYDDDWRTPTPSTTWEPTPTPTTQRETERMQTPANAQKLGARTSRRGSFSWGGRKSGPRFRGPS